MRFSFLRTTVLFIGAVVLASCAGYQPPGTTYIRTDGRDVSPDQLEADTKACSEAEKAQRCMLEKGYFLVQNEQLTEKQQTLAEIAQKNREAQEAAIAAEKAKQEALRREAARKKKRKKKPAPTSGSSNFQSPAARAQPNQQNSPWSQSGATSPTGFSPQR